MQQKPRSLKRVLWHAALVLAAIVALSLFFRWTGIGSLRSGLRKTLPARSETLPLAVETQEGDISLSIEDADGNRLFQQENIGTGTFQVSAAGRVKVLVQAKGHQGAFSLES